MREEIGKQITSVSEEGMQRLTGYAWPGTPRAAKRHSSVR